MRSFSSRHAIAAVYAATSVDSSIGSRQLGHSARASVRRELPYRISSHRTSKPWNAGSAISALMPKLKLA
jgi:hypothetical protein